MSIPPTPEPEAIPTPDARRDCPLCPRLVAFRAAARTAEPGWFNAPVPTWSAAPPVRLLVVGLAPGLRGANRTGRPFTGDYAGDLLYRTLTAHGFAHGVYEARADDGLALVGCAITNAVRCVPPQNKPTPAEIATCRAFLAPTLAVYPDLRAILALGRIAHESVVRALGMRQADARFVHGRTHAIDVGATAAVALVDSYHCSRYNTSTGVLTPAMFDTVVAAVRQLCDAETGRSDKRSSRL